MEASQQDNTNNEAMDVSQEDLQPEQQQNHPSAGATDPGTNPAAGIDQPASGAGTPNSTTTGIAAGAPTGDAGADPQHGAQLVGHDRPSSDANEIEGPRLHVQLLRTRRHLETLWTERLLVHSDLCM